MTKRTLRHDCVLRLLLVCLVALVCGGAAAAERLVWFGTFTRGTAGSEGIYVSRFDDASGTLTPPVLAAKVKNPGFLAFHPSLPVVYAVSEVADHDGKPTGGILSFSIDDRTGALTKKTEQPSGGAGPCHVSVDRTGKVVLAANYSGGSVICLGLDADGGLRPVATGSPGGLLQHEGKSVNEKRQEKPHAHSAYAAPDGRFAITCDLGIDKVLVHALDTAKATLASHSFAAVKPGAGPRHFAFHPSGRFGYACNELDLTVTGFTFDPTAGSLTEFQTLSTLPADVADHSGFSTAEIVAHPNGKFLYVSNRGHHSIAMFSVDEATGKLSLLGVEPIRGKTPRNFVLSPDGGFLLAAGQDSNTVTVFAIDPATGRLRFTGTSIDVPSPVCIRFRPR
ncbi:MAG: lactonase family protein [Planctomycetia bacterium]|nr:lactonase family protein [Planctomycetia bacterium]